MALKSEGEVIFIHLGQAGVQVGATLWELLCLEHSINIEGRFDPKSSSHDNLGHGSSKHRQFTKTSSLNLNETFMLDALNSVFHETSHHGRYNPRALFLDLDAGAIDELRNGRYGSVYHQDQLVAGKEDSANNYARGFYKGGKEFVGVAMDRIRKHVERAKNLQGFIIFRSIGGGTGSGFGSLILGKLRQEFPKLTLVTFDFLPSAKMHSAAVEPYNAVLASATTIDKSDVTFLLENTALQTICNRNLMIANPTFLDLNRLTSQVVSALTAPLRFGSTLYTQLGQLKTFFAPAPRLHFPVLSYAPIIATSRSRNQNLNVSVLMNQALDPRNRLAACDIETGKTIAFGVLFRGDIHTGDIQWTESSLNKYKIRFADWISFDYHVGLCRKPPEACPGGDMALSNQAALVIANSTNVTAVWNRIVTQYDALYSKKSFLHWYTNEGMEESEFTDARQNLEALLQEYEEAAGKGPNTAAANKAARLSQAPKKASMKQPLGATRRQTEGR